MAAATNFVATSVLQGVSTDLAGLLANASIIGVDNLVATPVVGTSAADTLAVVAAMMAMWSMMPPTRSARAPMAAPTP